MKTDLSNFFVNTETAASKLGSNLLGRGVPNNSVIS